MMFVCLNFADDVPEDLRAFCATKAVINDALSRGGQNVQIGPDKGAWNAWRSLNHHSDAHYPYTVLGKDGKEIPVTRQVRGTLIFEGGDSENSTSQVTQREWLANVEGQGGWRIYGDEALF